MEKTVNAEAKASLQPPSGIEKINSSCPKGYRPTIKDESSWDYRDSDMAKFSQNSSPTNAN